MRSVADLSAVAVVATVATVRVATADVTLVRARRVVPLASSTLNCECPSRDLSICACEGALELHTDSFLAVVDSAVAVASALLPLLKLTLTSLDWESNLHGRSEARTSTIDTKRAKNESKCHALARRWVKQWTGVCFWS